MVQIPFSYRNINLREFTWQQQFLGEGSVCFLILYKDTFSGKEHGIVLMYRENNAPLLLAWLYRNQLSLPAVSGRNMQAKRKIAFPEGRKKLPQETSLSVLKKVGNNNPAIKPIWISKDSFFLRQEQYPNLEVANDDRKGSQLFTVHGCSVLLTNYSYTYRFSLLRKILCLFC